MRYTLTQFAPPDEPVALEEVKRHLRVDEDITADDDLIAGMIQGAREWIENYCRRSLVARTVVLRLDDFPSEEIRLPRGPVISLTSIEYYDTAAALQTLSSTIYESDLTGVPARVAPKFGQVWPQVNPQQNAVIVTYEAGYSYANTSPVDYTLNIPAALKAALKLHVEAHYDRDPTSMERLMTAARSLLAPYEIRDFTLE